jgi:long-chain acyl-CoA synthetase
MDRTKEPRQQGIRPPGEIVECSVRAVGLTPGYYGQIDAGADPSSSGRWLHTGDLGRRDADGFLSFTSTTGLG